MFCPVSFCLVRLATIVGIVLMEAIKFMSVVTFLEIFNEFGDEGKAKSYFSVLEALLLQRTFVYN